MADDQKPDQTDEQIKEQIKDALRGVGDLSEPEPPISGGDVPRKPGFFSLKRNVTRDEVIDFFQELGNLLDSGYSILRALQVITLHIQNREFAAEIEHVASEVEKGSTFSRALSKHPWIFKVVDLNIIRAGEAAADLVEAIGFIVANDAHNEEVREKVYAAITYPVAVFTVAIVALVLILFVVVPSFAHNPMLKDIVEGDNLPFISQFIFTASDLLIGWWPLVVILLVGGGIAVRKVFFSRIVVVDRLKLSIPLFGKIIMLGAMSQFVHTLSILLRNGIPIVESLKLAKGSLDNAHLEHAVNMMIISVEQGKSMAEPLKYFRVIPPIAVDMMGVGEQSGRLSDVLDHLSMRFRVQLLRLTNRVSVFLEPLMLLLIGGLVMIVILALFLPYFHTLSGI